MPFIKYQPNPYNLDSAGDCTVRAISKVMDWDWYKTYLKLTLQGFSMGDVFSANAVWISFLLENGFQEHSLMSMCKNCYTLEKFARDISTGKYIVGDGAHAVAVIKKENDNEASWYDTWNSKNMLPIFYFEKVGDDEVNGSE